MSILNIGSKPLQLPKLPMPGVDYSRLPKTGREDNLAKPYTQQAREFGEQARHSSYSGAFQRCERKHGPMAKIIFGCAHVEEQDPVHPVGIMLTPYNYFICMECYKRYQLGKLDFWTELATRCHACILDEWLRIDQINPRLNKDWSKKSNRGIFA